MRRSVNEDLFFWGGGGLSSFNKVFLCANGKRRIKGQRHFSLSHENAIFLFSVLRVVQGEPKTPKIMGCCTAIFAFLHALKIGTFR